MTANIKGIIDHILQTIYNHDHLVKIVLFTTGGGANAVKDIFCPGSSSTILSYSIPYARAALQKTITSSYTTRKEENKLPLLKPKFCSANVVEKMAIAAWSHAIDLLYYEEHLDRQYGTSHFTQSNDNNLLPYHRIVRGIACSASLATRNIKKGNHEAYFSIYSLVDKDKYVQVGENMFHWLQPTKETFHLTLDKNYGRSREEEDKIVSNWLIYVMALGAYLEMSDVEALWDVLTAELKAPGDSFICIPSPKEQEANEQIDLLDHFLSDSLLSKKSSIIFLPPSYGHNGGTSNLPIIMNGEYARFKGILVPGSFNPLHKGHIELALTAQRILKSITKKELPIAFELSLNNVDKDSIQKEALISRVEQFLFEDKSEDKVTSLYPVFVTTAALFMDKAKLYPGATFVIGADTALRLVDAKYYHNDPLEMAITLQQIADGGSIFIIAGRMIEEKYVSAEEVCTKHIPRVLQSMFVPIKESDFRIDISSTELRRQRNAQCS